MKQIIYLVFIFLSISITNAQEDNKQENFVKPLEKGKLTNGVTIKDILAKRNKVKDKSTVTVQDVKITKYPLYKCSDTLDVQKQFRCLNRYLQKHVARRFNTDLATTNNLESGRHKIYCFFTISKDGAPTNIEAYSKYAIHEEEAKRVIGLLPKTNSAIVDKKPVALKYILPISFSVE